MRMNWEGQRRKKTRKNAAPTAVAAVHHVIIQLHHHERGVGHDAAQLARVEGSEGGALRRVLAAVQRLYRLRAAAVGARRVGAWSGGARPLHSKHSNWASLPTRGTRRGRTSCELSRRVGTVRAACCCCSSAAASAAAACARCALAGLAAHQACGQAAAGAGCGARGRALLLLAAGEGLGRASGAAQACAAAIVVLLIAIVRGTSESCWEGPGQASLVGQGARAGQGWLSNQVTVTILQVR